MEPGQTEFSETELRCVVYTDYRSPEGFYWEDLSLPGREGSASICYENTVSIDSTNEWVEMCTGRLSQARVWSETSARSSAHYRRLLDTTSTKRYLQFRRVYDKNPRDVLLSRVHKCSYFDPSEPFHCAGSSIKRDARGDSTPTDSISIGTFGPRPITPAQVRRLAEYFWFIGQYNTGGATALSSVSRAGKEAVGALGA